MLTARHLTRHHGAQVVLGGVSVSVHDGTRLGVVGPNGIGKSTLLRVLAGWLPQEPDARPGEPLRAYLARRTGVAAAGADLERATAAMGDDVDSIQAYSAALEHFLALGGDDLDARTGAVMAQVGMAEDRLDVAMGDLSGGQAPRATLAGGWSDYVAARELLRRQQQEAYDRFTAERDRSEARSLLARFSLRGARRPRRRAAAPST